MQAWHFALSSRAINCFFLQCMDSFYIFIPGDKNIKRKTSSWKESDRNDHTQRFFWDLGKVICLSEWYLPRWKDTSGFLGLSLSGQQLLFCWYRGHLWETLGSRWKDSPSAKHSCGSSQTLGSLKKLGSKLLGCEEILLYPINQESSEFQQKRRQPILQGEEESQMLFPVWTQVAERDLLTSQKHRWWRRGGSSTHAPVGETEAYRSTDVLPDHVTFWFTEEGSHHAEQGGLELTAILLSQACKCVGITSSRYCIEDKFACLWTKCLAHIECFCSSFSRCNRQTEIVQIYGVCNTLLYAFVLKWLNQAN